MKRLLLIFCFFAILQFVNSQSYELFNLSTNSDPSIWAGSEIVSNTGCDRRDFQGQGDMDVVVWDRVNSNNVPQNAMFGWKFQSYGGTFGLNGGAITDPDIVLGIYENEMYAFVTYINGNGYAAYEVWYYDLQNNSWVNTTTSTAMSSGSGCLKPNVDVNINGQIVVVWDQNAEIKARTGIITGSMSANISTICNQNTNSVPDVAIHTIGASSVVIFTYINEDATYYNLRTQTESYSNVAQGTPSLNALNAKRAVIANAETFGSPRIAAPPCNNTYFSLGDYTIVVAFNTSNAYEIYGYNVFQGSVNTLVINDQDPDIYFYPQYDIGTLKFENSSEPVVSYCQQDNEIIVLWTYSNSASKYSGPGVPVTAFDIMRRRLNPDLSHINFPSSPYLPFYSLVNNTLSYIQYRPSVAQRHAQQTDRANYVFVTYRWNVSGTNTDIIMKDSQTNNYNLRKGKTDPNSESYGIDTKVLMYPNPAMDNFLIFEFEEKDSYANVVIFDVTGRIVYKTLVLGTTRISLENLNQGMYIVEITTDREKISKKLQIIK